MDGPSGEGARTAGHFMVACGSSVPPRHVVSRRCVCSPVLLVFEPVIVKERQRLLERDSVARPPGQGISVFAKICHARTDFATRLRMTYCHSPKR